MKSNSFYVLKVISLNIHHQALVIDDGKYGVNNCENFS